MDKQKEFYANKKHDDEVEDKQPQLFVNEVLKMHERGDLDEDTLDEQVVTMLVGVKLAYKILYQMIEFNLKLETLV